MGTIASYNKIKLINSSLKKKRLKTVLVHGIFDILHHGHVYLLTETKKLGDVLIVGLECDSNVKKLKGKERPINKLQSRLFVVSNVVGVDYTFPIPVYGKREMSEFYLDMYMKLKPDIVASAINAGKYGKYKKIQAKAIGSEFVDISGYIHKNNTSKVVKLLNL